MENNLDELFDIAESTWTVLERQSKLLPDDEIDEAARWCVAPWHSHAAN